MTCDCQQLHKDLQRRAAHSTSSGDLASVKQMFATQMEYMTVKCPNKRNVTHLPTPMSRPVKLDSTNCTQCQTCSKIPVVFPSKIMSADMLKRAQQCRDVCIKCSDAERVHMTKPSKSSRVAIDKMDTQIRLLTHRGPKVRCNDIALSLRDIEKHLNRVDNLKDIKNLQAQFKTWMELCRQCPWASVTVNALNRLELQLLKKRRRML